MLFVPQLWFQSYGVGFTSLGPRHFSAKRQNKCWKAFGHVGQNLHGDHEEFVRQACKPASFAFVR